MVGSERANKMFSGGIHILSAGASDYIQNYYINPYVYRQYTPDQYADLLMASFTNFVQVSLSLHHLLHLTIYTINLFLNPCF